MSTYPSVLFRPFPLRGGGPRENLPKAVLIDSHFYAPTPCHRYTRGFLTYYNHGGVSFLAESQRGPVSGPQRLVYYGELSEGKYGPGGEDISAIDDNRSVM